MKTFLEVHPCPVCGGYPSIDKSLNCIDLFCCVLSSIKNDKYFDKNEMLILNGMGLGEGVNKTLTNLAIIHWNSKVAEFKEN